MAIVPEALGLTRSRLQALIAAGQVSVDGAPARSASQKVAPGAVLHLTVPAPEPAEILAEDIPLAILHEDADLIVVNKPTGMVVHPAPGAWTGTLVNALMHHCGDSLSGIGGTERPGIVHRIDKDTSGLLVVAKSDVAHQALSKAFARHDIDRIYEALTWGLPDAGDPRVMGLAGVSSESGGVLKIDAPLGRHKADRKKMAIRRDGEGRHAITRITPLGACGPAGHVRCRLETGRTHQIRVHAAYIGHPLMGDPTYGGARKLPAALAGSPVAAALAALPGQALHAGTLGFKHPVSGQALSFSAPPPESFTKLLTALQEVPA